MATAETSEARIHEVRVTDKEIIADLMDGRTISVPLAWSWRLSEATPEQRANVRIIGGGRGAHWPDVDEDLSARGMLSGTPPRDRRSSCIQPASSGPIKQSAQLDQNSSS